MFVHGNNKELELGSLPSVKSRTSVLIILCEFALLSLVASPLDSDPGSLSSFFCRVENGYDVGRDLFVQQSQKEKNGVTSFIGKKCE